MSKSLSNKSISLQAWFPRDVKNKKQIGNMMIDGRDQNNIANVRGRAAVYSSDRYLVRLKYRQRTEIRPQGAPTDACS